MSLADFEPKSGSRHVCQLIALTGQQGPVLYKGDNVAAGPPESGPAETGGLSVSNLPLVHPCVRVLYTDLRAGQAVKIGNAPV